MEYQALYRRWRPKTFDDVVGQGHVTETIKNEIKNNTCGHAFLFCGSRGTGKTSTARILSRAVNCENPDNGNPCNKCPTCMGIEDGSIMDIVEIDAASNSGVDNIRSLREEANYNAAVTKKKVYIIDEVHALSKDAFNALLKLLEEPPAHVMFVLATTEANKVLETISSRCQRFDFKRITPEDIYDRLDYICSAEGIIAEERALRMIATAAAGSLRDALSYLEPCLAAGKEIKTEFVEEFLGKAENSSVIELCGGIGMGSAQEVLECISSLSARGRNLSPFIETVIKALRDMLVISITGNCKSDFEGEEYEKLKEYSAYFSSEKLLYAIKVLSEAISTARFMTEPRVVFEAALVKLCVKGSDGSVESLLQRIGELERKLEGGVQFNATVKPETQKREEASPVLKEEKKKAVIFHSELVDKIKAVWPEVMNEMAGSLTLYAALENASLREENGRLAITFPDLGGRAMQDLIKDSLDIIKEAVERHVQAKVDIVTRLEGDLLGVTKKDEHDLFDDIINLPITNRKED